MNTFGLKISTKLTFIKKKKKRMICVLFCFKYKAAMGIYYGMPLICLYYLTNCKY